MPEWVIEEGIGETRAALIENDEIIETRVRREGTTPAGTVLEAKLVAVAPRVTVEGPFDKRVLDPAFVRDQETLVTRGYHRLREITNLGLATIIDYPLPEVVAKIKARTLGPN